MARARLPRRMILGAGQPAVNCLTVTSLGDKLSALGADPTSACPTHHSRRAIHMRDYDDRTLTEKIKESAENGLLAPLWMGLKIAVGLFLVYLVISALLD